VLYCNFQCQVLGTKLMPSSSQKKKPRNTTQGREWKSNTQGRDEGCRLGARLRVET
jgi:hypothetical protein